VIRLTRLPEPAVLTRNGARWTEEFVASDKARPEDRRYAHKEIKATLRAISGGKCFYCEWAVPESEIEVDHHVEVSKDRSLAFSWNNLYLSCRGCNDKLPESTIPRADVLDPFDTQHDPTDHLCFDDEKVYARAGSAHGSATIGKYKLHREDLELERAKALKELYKLASELQRKGIPWSDCEPILRAFTAPDRPFSAMMKDALRQWFP
jgi:5-methylcytosine-specific restriction endonuclease McrA